MSQETQTQSHPSRTVEEVTKEYQQKAFEVGNISYQIHCLTQDLEKHYEKMIALNQEGARLMSERAKNIALKAQGTATENLEASSVEAPAPMPLVPEESVSHETI
jgi:2C-methyl-D-erythritol 2,4-cyclodiphosphate synthase